MSQIFKTKRIIFCENIFRNKNCRQISFSHKFSQGKYLDDFHENVSENGNVKLIFAKTFAKTQYLDQGCESRRQTFSSISRPRFRDFGKVSALPRSLTLLGKKVSPGSRPRFGFSRPNTAGNEIPIANR